MPNYPVQMPSRLNLCRIQTAVESLQPDQPRPGGRPPSGSPAKQTPVSPTFSKLHWVSHVYGFNRSMVCYTMHSFPFGNIWCCCVMPKSLLSSQCQITSRTNPLLSRLKSQWETWTDKFLPSRWDFPDNCMHVSNIKTFFSNSQGLQTFRKWFSKYLNTCNLYGQGILSITMQPEFHIGHWPYANQLLCDSPFFPHVSTNKETIVDP